jgi:hypothetical protein
MQEKYIHTYIIHIGGIGMELWSRGWVELAAQQLEEASHHSFPSSINRLYLRPSNNPSSSSKTRRNQGERDRERIL